MRREKHLKDSRTRWPSACLYTAYVNVISIQLLAQFVLLLRDQTIERPDPPFTATALAGYAIRGCGGSSAANMEAATTALQSRDEFFYPASEELLLF